jgi:hypothetical protein
MATKNLAGKRRNLNKGEAPYEVWTGPGGWTFFVVKKNQADDDKPYAIWNVACITPHERDLYGHDTYVSDVKDSMRLVWLDPAYKQALEQAEMHLSLAYTTADSSPNGWKRYMR